MSASQKALDVRNTSLSFGGLKAVSDFSLALEHQSLTGLIGPNGAGKTTVFNLLTGVYAPDQGTIDLAGQSLLGKRPHERAKAGVARTFQNIRLFGEMTVLDNVRVACRLRANSSFLATAFRLPSFLREESSIVAQAESLLDLFGLLPFASAAARNLPYGQQRRLEIARALATKPKVLLLDEPAAGMTPQEKVELSALIQRVRVEFECTVLLIEHDMSLVMQVCERIAVLDHGVKIAEGGPSQIQKDASVIEAYLGQGAAHGPA